MRLSWLYLLFILSVVGLQSCGDDPEPDQVAEASGTYNYKTKLYYVDGNSLEYLGSDFDESGTAIMTKTSTGFEVKEGGDVQFRATKVAKASNGFTFDIETQTIDVDGTNVTVEGYDGAVLSGVKYNGLYISATKELTGYFKFDGVVYDDNGNEYDVTFVIEWKATKA
jgi:hypothetical protein